MERKTVIVVAVLVACIAVATPILLALSLARSMAVRQKSATAELMALDVIQQTDETLEQVTQALHKLEQAATGDPCDPAMVRTMARLDMESDRVLAFGVVRDDAVVCSSYGRSEEPAVGPAEITARADIVVRTHVRLPLAPDREFILFTDLNTGYSAAVSPELTLSVPVEDANTALGIYGATSGHVIVSRGPAFTPQPGSRPDTGVLSTEFADDHLVAQRRSARFETVAFAAIPAANVSREVRRTAMMLVPAGLLAGLVLALAVYFIARVQMSLPALIRAALRRHELFLVYQPVVELATGRWVGAEALVRWKRPGGELVRPDIFIPVAEETGLIQRITERVIELVTRDAEALLQRHRNFHVGINLSYLDLQSDRTPALLERMAVALKAGPQNLLVEATERGFMKADEALAVLRRIRGHGIRIAIDDFGTGYSSLSYLGTFDLDFLKVDRSFVSAIGTGSASSLVVLHIIEMARSLGLDVIAEGVETEDQAAFLREKGVRFAQGWLFGKPMGVAELLAGLDAGR